MLEKQNLLGLPRDKLKIYFSNLGEKSFRTKQIMQCIYRQDVKSFGSMHNLSKDLCKKLQAIATIDLPEVMTLNHAKDGVIK